jgi:hypothetical protein
MALGAVHNERPDFALANAQAEIATVQLDTAYPTGGSIGLASKLGMDPEKMVILIIIDAGPYHIRYSQGLDKLQVFQQSAATGALTEVPNATNLSATTIRVLALTL